MQILHELILIIILSISFDYFIGEPPNRFHPVVWIGKGIDIFTKQIKKKDFAKFKIPEKMSGSILALSLTSILGVFAYVIIIQSVYTISTIAFIFISVFILKSTFSIKAMDMHIKDILNDIKKRDIEKARFDLLKIVSRKTNSLSEEKILSASIECIAESFVDGILSPLLYYGILNIPGALMFRIINTLDSMIGYKDKYYKDIGWMSAKMDTIMNWIPARVSIVFLVLSSLILKQDWKNAVLIYKRDGMKTESLNSGIPMSIIAGALKIQLEKIGHYKLGDMNEQITIEKCKIALKITKIATLIFITVFLFPIIILLNLLNWWSILFGH
ncbi:MAG: cobalamin biosynthesis protein [Candidatus Nitrosocosmicus sp.]